MKTKKFIILIAVLTITLISCSSYISKSDAMDVAMTDLGLIQINVSDLTAKLDKENDPAAYTVTFVFASQNYTYFIDAETGEILSKKITQ